MIVNKNILKFINTFFIGIFISVAAQAQTEFMIYGTIKTYESSVEGAKVKVMQDFITIKTIVLDNTGTYSIYLPYGKNYNVIFEKPGYTKMQFDAILNLPGDVKQCCYRPLELSFHLFKAEISHEELFSGTFHNIAYDKNFKGFIYDIDVDYMVQQRIVNAELFKQQLNESN